MGVTTFEIESYKISIVQNLDSYTKTIKLLSTNQSHGIRFDVTLLFLAANPYKNQGTIGQVSNFGGTNFDPIGLAVWVDIKNFESFYQVMSSEKPVYLSFNAVTPEVIADVDMVRLTTDTEKPGDFEQPKAVRMPPKL
jgi:hypothetical protein